MPSPTHLTLLSLSLTIVAHVSLVAGSRVIDRFPGSRWPVFGRCRISKHETLVPLSSLIGKYIRDMSHRLEAMNCTTVETKWWEIGTADSNGNYSGLIGLVQRDEVDLAEAPVRSDGFPVVAAHVVSLGFSAEEVIISKQNKTTSFRVPLLKMWASTFSLITLYYVMLVIAIFVVVLTVANVVSLSTYGLVIRISGNYFNAFSALVDQENFNPVTYSAKVLVFSFCVFLLFLMHAIVSGSLGADLSVDYKPPIVESMHEFTNDSWMQPIVPKMLYLPSFLRTTRDPELIHLKHLLETRPSNVLVCQDLASCGRRVADIMGQVYASRRAVIIPRFVAEVHLRQFGCAVMPDILSVMGVSQTSFAPGVLVMMMSKKIDPILRQALEYAVRTIAETGLLDGMTRSLTRSPEILSLLGSDSGYGTKNMECKEGPSVRTDHPPQSFDMTTFEQLFAGLFICLTFCAVVFCLEIALRRVIMKISPLHRLMKNLILNSRRKVRLLRKRRVAPKPMPAPMTHRLMVMPRRHRVYPNYCLSPQLIGLGDQTKIHTTRV